MSEHPAQPANPLASKSSAWSGRFDEPVADFVLRYNASVGLARAVLHLAGSPERGPAWLNEGLAMMAARE